MKRFINDQTNKYWEIAYISDTKELIIRTGTIGSKNIGNFNIQSGFDGEEGYDEEKRLLQKKQNNLKWKPVKLVISKHKLNDLRLEHYDFSVPPQKINRNISPEPKQVVKPTKKRKSKRGKGKSKKKK